MNLTNLKHEQTAISHSVQKRLWSSTNKRSHLKSSRFRAAFPQPKLKKNSNDTYSMALAVEDLTYYYKVLLIVG